MTIAELHVLVGPAELAAAYRRTDDAGRDEYLWRSEVAGRPGTWWVIASAQVVLALGFVADAGGDVERDLRIGRAVVNVRHRAEVVS